MKSPGKKTLYTERAAILALFFLSTVLFSCATAPSGQADLSAVDDFLFQLQDVDLPAIGATRYDLVVIDYSVDGTDPYRWSSRQVKTLKNSVGGKIVLAYLSIGEAEEYRFYWDFSWADELSPDPDAPDWLGRVNQDWPGNFKVKYWKSGWQDIVFSYLDRIIGQGFDGIYLDIVDAYWYWSNEAASIGEDETLSVKEAADRMVGFITSIAGYCRSRRSAFIICPQNASGIIHDASPGKAAEFLNMIDAIGAESTFYYGNADEDNPYNPQVNTIQNLDSFVGAGKRVLAIEYLTESNLADVDEFYALCESHGFVPFATMRNLDVLRINAGHEPD